MVNGLAQIHGVSLSSKSLGSPNKPVELLYLDALDPSQLTEADFLFATSPPAAAITNEPRAADGQPTNGLSVMPTPSAASSIELVEAPPRVSVSENLFGNGESPLIGPRSTVWMADSAEPWTSEAISTHFSASEGDATAYSISLSDGSPLPDWLTFDAASNQLRMASGEARTAALKLNVKATTEAGQEAATTLTLLVQPGVLKVGHSERVSVEDSQVAIHQAGLLSAVTATGGRHVLLQSGDLTSAQLAGDGAHEVTVTGMQTNLALGAGGSTAELLGVGAKVVAGDGNYRVSGSDPTAEISLGNGDNVVSGAFRRLSVGAGRNVIESTGAIATLRLGDGEDIATLKGAMATVHVGHGKYDLEYEGSLGKLVFGPDITSDRLWFRHTGQDLDVSVTGSSDTVKLKDWYAPTEDRPATIVAGDGKQLHSRQVQNLVQAMAAFSPPPAGTISLTPAQQASLQPALAANWR